jgi:hypothetical protein
VEEKKRSITNLFRYETEEKLGRGGRKGTKNAETCVRRVGRHSVSLQTNLCKTLKDTDRDVSVALQRLVQWQPCCSDVTRVAGVHGDKSPSLRLTCPIHQTRQVKPFLSLSLSLEINEHNLLNYITATVQTAQTFGDFIDRTAWLYSNSLTRETPIMTNFTICYLC